MRWTTGRRSENIEDRRGRGGGVPLAAGGGIGTIVILLLALYFGIDPSIVLQGGDPTPAPPGQSRTVDARDDELRDFVAVVLGDTEDTWRALFAQGRQE
jgi:hypothetical protein